MSDPIRVAIVGAGHLGSIHARVMSECEGAKLVAIVDVDADRAATVAGEFGVESLDSITGLAEKVDAAVVATPTASHHEVASDLLERGLHVLVEKPITTTVDQARALVDTARRSDRVLMVGHSERFNPVIRALGKQGLQPRFIDSQRVSPFSFRSADIGVVYDMMIHDIDIILHLIRSPVEAVHAVGIPVIGDNEDLANARLVFDNGAVANATASRVALKTERVMRIFSSDCYVTLDFQKKSGRVIRKGRALLDGSFDFEAELAKGMANPLAFMKKDLVRIEELEIDDVEPLRAEDEAFLTAIRDGTPPPVSGEHGLAALETAQRIVGSLQDSLAKVSSQF